MLNNNKNEVSKLKIASFKVALIYCFFGSLWIISTGALLKFFPHDLAEKIEIYKGLFYVFITATIVYYGAFRALRKNFTNNLKYQLLVNSIDEIVFTIDSNNVITNTYGNNLKELLKEYPNKGSNFYDFFSWENNRNKDLIQKVLNEDKIVFDYYLEDTSNNKRLFQIQLTPLRDLDTKIIGVLGVGRDITKIKESELSLAKSNKEKDILIKEVHHRVKNNLQIISSLINLQIKSIKTEDAKDVLKSIKNRINSMALIHKELYLFNNFTNVNFSDYIENLVEYFYSIFLLDDKNIQIVTNIEKVFLLIDDAIPCALLINELISNALKYAFENRDEGKILLNIKEIDKKIFIKVSDNGKGINKEVNIKDSKSFGLYLVNNLVTQLNGNLNISVNNGSTFDISFQKREFY